MRFYRVGIDSLVSVIDSLRRLGCVDPSVVVKFTGLSRSTVDRCLRNGMALDLVAVREKNEYYLNLTNGSTYTREAFVGAIRSALQTTRLFQVICEFLDEGVDTDSALRRALMITGSNSTQVSDVTPILDIGCAVGVLARYGKGYTVATTIDTKQHEVGFSEQIATLDSEMAALLYLSRQFGSELFNTLDNNEQKRLVEAVLAVVQVPEVSCEKAGQALENYLRLIGIKTGLDMSSFDGLGQLADYLAAKERLVIHPKHRDMTKGVAALRNCTAHDRDKLTNISWRVSPEMAAANVHMVIRLIVSIASWVERCREQVL